ncbi:MAG: AMP-binding protein, partial [Planctomycetota bacterium]
HDMGLIGGILAPLYVGGTSVLMSPRSFLQRPLRWLQEISEHRAVISGAPNFAYQLCVDRISPVQVDELKLDCWKTAFCGAEPILPRTLIDFGNRFARTGFSRSAFYPCYGLAEATLLAAGGDGPSEPRLLTVHRSSLGNGTAAVDESLRGNDAQQLVGCGGAAHQTDLRIVDPSSGLEVQENQVGEIWLRGASVAAGYWSRDEENEARFNAQLHGDSGAPGGFCRTGDLGFLHGGQLFITGRQKDVIILRGRNHFPQDIEATVKETVGSEGGQCAAFAVAGPRGESLAVVAELPRRSDPETHADLVRAIRRAVIDVHEIDPRHVLLVRQATVPLTSSGKVQRSRCRELLEADQIKSKYRFDRKSLAEQTPIPLPDLPRQPVEDDRPQLSIAVETWLAEWLIARAGVPPAEVALEKPFADFGLDSMTAVELSGEMEDWSGVELNPVIAWNYPTIERMSAFIADELIKNGGQDLDEADLDQAELDGLLDEIEQLSDDEAKHALADKRRH